MLPPKPETFWPTPHEEQLLKAALLNGPQAVTAWNAWYAEADIDHLEPASFRLLPLLYHNLKPLGVEHPFMARMKGIYRRDWYRNQILLNEGAQVIKFLAGQKFQSLVLKGAAWSLLYYPDPGLRPIGDFDLLVPSYQALLIIKRLQAAGWGPAETPHIPFSPGMLNITHGRGMRNAKGYELDLHWHIFHTDLEREADADFWDTAQPMQINDVEAHTLQATDHFLHSCSLVTEWADARPIWWVADAVQLLKTVPNLDWDRFCAQVEKHRLSLEVQTALGYLTKTFDLPIPGWVVDKVKALPASANTQRIFEANLYPPELRPVNYKIWFLWRGFQRLTVHESWLEKAWKFPGYLRDIWGLPSTSAVPGYALGTILARMRRISGAQDKGKA